MFNVEEYIASGTIEACLLGLATPEEVAEMHRLARLHPAVAAEVEAVRRTVDGLHTAAGSSHAKTPPAHLKAKILSAAFAEIPEIETPPASNPQSTTPPSTAAPASKLSPFTLLACAVAVVNLIGFVVIFFFFNQQGKELSALEKAHASSMQELAALGVKSDSLSGVLALCEQDKDSLWMACSKKVMLEGTKDCEHARAFVYYNAPTGEVMAEVESLPAAPQGMEYQLWAIVDGKPQGIGMFKMEGTSMGIAVMGPAKGAAVFAITLEPAGGSVGPTSPICVVGAV